MKRWLLTPAVALALAALVHAAPQIEADPNKDYPITPEAGTWVIVCANYKGPDALDLSRQLVYQLRSKHNQPAYLYCYSDKKRAEMKQEEERWKQERPGFPFKRWKIEDEYAVFLGGFADMETARAFMMKEVKTWLPPELKLPGGKSAYDQALMQYPTGPNGSMKLERVSINPLINCFVSRNPTLSATARHADPFLKELNAGEDYSLLNCKEPLTLAVKEFRGKSEYVNQLQGRQTGGSLLDKLNPFSPSSRQLSSLDAGALQAHEMAAMLRKLKFEAYVLHTRTSSIVTIGSFKSVEDPALQTMLKQLAAIKVGPALQADSKQPAAVQAGNNKSLIEEARLFMIPMEVPRP